MGKGDKKTRRGKITMGSYGKTRPHKKQKPQVNGGQDEAVEPVKSKKAVKSKKG